MNDFIAKCTVALERFRKISDGNDPNILNFPYNALVELTRAAAGFAKKDLLLLCPVIKGYYRTDNYIERLWRQLSKRGLRIRKLVVVPHRGIAASTIKKMLNEDLADGITVEVVTVSELVDNSITESTTQFIFDRNLVIRGPLGENNISETLWTASARPEDVETATKRWEEIWSWASNRPNKASLSLEEPLILSADLISGVADVLCTADHIDQGGCSWYHGAWQYLRLFDLVSTPSWHDNFYKDNLLHVINSLQNPSVLITGTADYSVLAYVLDATQNTNSCIQVLDLCPTPLFACRWYAQSVGQRITVKEEDLFKTEIEKKSNIIVTDAFLTRFSPIDAAKVIRRWRDLLSIDGFVITTVRVHDPTQRGQSEEEAVLAFAERALIRARRWAPFLKKTPDELATMAESYARKMISNKLGKAEDIIKLFQQGGFHVVSHEKATVPGELWPSTYLRILAQAKSGGN